MKQRILDAVEAAQEAFWLKIAEFFPEAKSGDFSPGADMAIRDAMSVAAESWVEANVVAPIETSMPSQPGHQRHLSWERDDIQFPRLLAEINATQSELNLEVLATSMDLSVEEVRSLFERADKAWESIKGNSVSSGEAVGIGQPPEKENSVTEILQHRISWYLRGDAAPEELDESSVEHIERLIKEGYNQGELCVVDNEMDKEFRGWWQIEPASEH